MKTIIIILMLISAHLQSQTMEERMQRVEDSLNIVWTTDPIDTTLPKPVYEGIVMQSNTSDQFIFNPGYTNREIWDLYCVKSGQVYLAQSLNGLNGWTYYLTNAKAGSIVNYGDKNFLSYHSWYSGLAYSYFAIALDKINFQNVATLRYPTGEDRNLIWNGQKFISLGRPEVPPAIRSIMYQESSDFRSWTYPVKVLSPDSQDGPNVDFYHISVIQTDNGYFGLLNLYYRGNSGQDVEQLPPYSAREHTTELQLVWSSDCKTWTRLNQRKVFISRKAGIEQMFAWWSVIGDQVYIYTCESARKHTVWANTYDKPGKYYFSSRYKISLTNLYLYH